MCHGLRPRKDEREKLMVVPWLVVLWVKASGLRLLCQWVEAVGCWLWVCGGLGGDIEWEVRIKKN